jgi:hypothetical protein
VRRSGSGLVDVDDKLIAERAAGDFVSRADDGVGQRPIEPAERGVGLGSGFLDENGCGDERRLGAQPADGEVVDRARRLDAVVRVGGDRLLAERVALDPKNGVGGDLFMAHKKN